MTRPATWQADEIVGQLRGVGLAVNAAWVERNVPGGALRYPDRPPGVDNPREWPVADVQAWRKERGLHRKRDLVRSDELARRTGLSYWQVRRRYDPVLVFGRTDHWYEV